MSITVKELKEILAGLPDDMEIIMSKDSEGNKFSPLSDVDYNSIYVPETTWYGTVYSDSWTADEACYDDEEEWQEVLKQPRVLVLWPTN
jgi:hypothetical protein